MATVTRYVDTNSSGGDGTTQNHSGGTAAYASLSAWEAAEQTNLVTDGDTHIVYCAGGADTTSLTITGWTTGASNKITIQADPSAPGGDGKNDTAAWSSSYYYLNDTTSPSNGMLKINEDFVDISGIQFQQDAGSGTLTYSIHTYFINSGGTFLFEKCRFKNLAGNSGSSNQVVRNGDADATITMECCTIWDLGSTGTSNVGVFAVSSGYDINVYNCTVTGFTRTFDDGMNGSAVTARNCAVFNNDDDFSGCTVDYCASDDGDGTNSVDISPGGTEATDWAAAFTDYANGDFTIKNTSSVLYNAGTATNQPSTDIIGNSFTTNDIGAFAFVGGATTHQGTGTCAVAVNASASTKHTMSDAAGTAAIAVSASASGLVTKIGAGTCAISVSASADATPKKLGTGTVAIAVNATGAALATRIGAGTAAIAVNAAADGLVTRQATGTVTTAVSVSGAALVKRVGAGTAAVAISVSGNALATRIGAGTAAISVDATGAALRTAQATGVAAIAVNVSGNGTVSSAAQQGAGTCALAISATGAALAYRPGAGTCTIAVNATGSATTGTQQGSGACGIEVGASASALLTAQAAGTVTVVVSASGALVPLTTITDTDILQLPINAVLHDRPVAYSKRSGVLGTQMGPIRERGDTNRSSVGRLSRNRPSFTVTTSGKGYD